MKAIDPILVSVLARRFKSITEEMGLTLLRTTRSPILCMARDFVTGLYDGKGRMLEQTEYLPVLAFALQPACRYIVDYYGEDLHPGDVVIHNDVFSGGNQNNDVAIYKPIFFQGHLVAWAATKGHEGDIGGGVAGGCNPQATEVWQEALRIPPVKVYDRGVFRKDVWDLIFANIRFPIVAADIRAQIGGAVVGERGITAMLGKYGLETFQSHMEYLFDSTEKMMRAEIRAIPDGVYQGESSFNFKDLKCHIRVTITVAGDDITVDYAGTDKQVAGIINAPFSTTFSHLMELLLMVIDPNIPHNEGIIRPVHLIAPEGSLVNASFPAATFYGNFLVDYTSEAIFKALQEALPEMVTAAWERTLGFRTTGWVPR
ncbi:MAG: hydantoinase B/oxoprolinase family protein [Dehalococcoidia bacterium]|nr:hydantoinase B/oxoprolinase family protein [Dehalococcoidia bacterium]